MNVLQYPDDKQKIWLKARLFVPLKYWQELYYEVIMPIFIRLKDNKLNDYYYVFFDDSCGESLNISICTGNYKVVRKELNKKFYNYVKNIHFDNSNCFMPGKEAWKHFESGKIYYNTYTLNFYSNYSSILENQFTPKFFMSYSNAFLNLIKLNKDTLDRQEIFQFGLFCYLLLLHKAIKNNNDTISIINCIIALENLFTFNDSALKKSIKSDVSNNMDYFKEVLLTDTHDEKDYVLKKIKIFVDLIIIPINKNEESIKLFKNFLDFLQKSLSISPIGISIMNKLAFYVCKKLVDS